MALVPSTRCDHCETDKIESAAYFCHTCTHGLCNACKEKHDKIPDTRRHNVTLYSRIDRSVFNVSIDCDIHKEHLLFFCDECKQLICCTCVTTTHKSHPFSDVANVVAEIKETIGCNLKTIEINIEDLLKIDKKGKMYLNALEEDVKKVTLETVSTSNTILQILAAQVTICITRNEDFENLKKDEINVELQRLERVYWDYVNVQNEYENMLTEKNDLKFLHDNPIVQSHFLNLEEVTKADSELADIPGFNTKIFIIDLIEKLCLQYKLGSRDLHYEQELYRKNIQLAKSKKRLQKKLHDCMEECISLQNEKDKLQHNLEEKTSQLKNLEARLSVIKEENLMLKKDHTTLKDGVQEMTGELKTSEQRISVIKDENLVLKKDNLNLKNIVQEKSVEIETTEGRLNSALRALEELDRNTVELARLKKKLLAEEEKVMFSKEENNVMQKENIKLREDNHNLFVQLQKSVSRLNISTDKTSDLHKTNVELDRILKHKSDQLISSESRLLVMKEDNMTLQKDNSDLKNSVQEKSRQLKLAEEKFQDITGSIENSEILQRRINTLEPAILELDKKLNISTDKTSDLYKTNVELDRILKQKSEQLISSESRQLVMKEDNMTLQKDNSDLKNSVQEKSRQLKLAEEKFQDIAGSIENAEILQRRINTLESAILELDKKLNISTDKTSDLYKTNVELDRILKQKSEQLISSESSLLVMKEDNMTLQKDNSDLKNSVQEKSRQLKLAEEKFQDIAGSIENAEILQRRINTLEPAILELDKKLNISTDKTSDLYKTNVELDRILKQKSEQLISSESRLIVMKEDNMTLQKDNSDLKNSVQEKSRQLKLAEEKFQDIAGSIENAEILQRRINTLESAILELDKKLNISTDKTSDLHKTNVELDRILKQKSDQLISSESRLLVMKEDNMTLQKDNSDLKNSVQKKSRQLKLAEEKFQDIAGSIENAEILQRRINTLEPAILELDKKLSEIKKDNLILQKDNLDLKNSVQEKSRNLKIAEERFQDIAGSIENAEILQRRINTLESAILELDKKCNRLQEKEQNFMLLKKEHQQLKTELVSKRQINETLNSRLEILNVEKQEIEKRCRHLETKEKDVQKLMKEKQQLEIKLFSYSQNNETLNSRLDYLNDEKQIIEERLRQCSSLEVTDPRRCQTCFKYRNDIYDLKREINDLRERYRVRQYATFDRLERAVLHCRLAEAAGKKLRDNNPNIADLSDMNRPTSLAEKFSSMYTDEYTDAMEVIEDDMNEEASVQVMLQWLKGCYDWCERLAKEQRDTLINKSIGFMQQYGGQNLVLSDRCLIFVKEFQKKIAVETLVVVRQVCHSKSVTQSALSSENYIIKYIKKCCELCWMMQISDPPLYLKFDVKSGGDLHKTDYNVFTKSGNKIDYLVWPILYLHKTGPMLAKGVAQGK